MCGRLFGCSAWIRSIGGLRGAIEKSEHNLKIVKNFVDERNWIDFLASLPETVSNTSVCLKLSLTADKVKSLVKLLESENVAYDIGSYRDAPAGIRIWCGATVEEADLVALLPWIDWAFHKVK